MPSEGTFWKHGIDEDFYEALLEKQNGLCAICLKPDARLVIDHAHDCCGPMGWKGSLAKCGLCVRGLLCVRCNTMLGYLETTPPEHIARAKRYARGANPRGYIPRIRQVA